MRKWILFGLGAIILLGCFLLWHSLQWPWREQIGPAPYDRINLGMAEAEVEAIIGLPPGIHRTLRPVGGITSAGNFGNTVAQSGIPEDDLPASYSGLARDGKTMITVRQ